MKTRYIILIFAVAVIAFGTVNISLTKDDNRTDIIYKPSTGVTVTKSKVNTEEDDCTYTMCSSLGGGISGDTLAISTMFGD